MILYIIDYRYYRYCILYIISIIKYCIHLILKGQIYKYFGVLGCWAHFNSFQLWILCLSYHQPYCNGGVKTNKQQGSELAIGCACWAVNCIYPSTSGQIPGMWWDPPAGSTAGWFKLSASVSWTGLMLLLLPSRNYQAAPGHGDEKLKPNQYGKRLTRLLEKLWIRGTREK